MQSAKCKIENALVFDKNKLKICNDFAPSLNEAK